MLHPRKLTDRQRQIWELISQGLGNKEIAVRLGISENTVERHVTCIYQRLGVRNRVEASAILIQCEQRGNKNSKE